MRDVANAMVTAAGVALLVAACGGSSGSHVAQLGSTAAQAASSSGPSSGGGATNVHSPGSQMLAFSHCMRSHAVASFPDPDSSGVLPKAQVAGLAAGSPQFVPAHRACGHLLPNGGRPTSAQVRQAWADMRSFAHCMRSHGVPNWPDPTDTSPQDHRPFFDTPAAIDPTAPRITARIDACRRVLHGGNPLVTTQ
jgi:hypothetical protein